MARPDSTPPADGVPSQSGVVDSRMSASEVGEALCRMGLLETGRTPALVPLTGGVSSDIWRVDLAVGPACIKRALPRLRVAADWRAPVERNAYEVAWIRCAGDIVPNAVPEILGEDAVLGMFVMRYFDPSDYPLWKTQLSAGHVDTGTATRVGERLVRIHAATAGDDDIRSRFATDDTFHAIRLDPYLLATARAHPELAASIEDIVAATASHKRALVHGDVSPKNILVGPHGPVFLDAECAWYGDPAFDLAFCLKHLLLKCLLVPTQIAGFLACFETLVNEYLTGVDWESPAELEERAAHLLPALFLARVDGKSPVEYVTRERDRQRVRRVAARLLHQPVSNLAAVSAAWREELDG